MSQPLTLGDFELTILSDGVYKLDGGAFFGVVPKTLWSKKTACDELNRASAGLNSLLVRDGKRTVLIETGMGNKLSEKLTRFYQPQARLLASLESAGVKPSEVDVVINSHLHFDHCGWNTRRDGDAIVPTFPNARYYAQRGEWEHAQLQLERDRVTYLSENYDPLVASGQMQLLDGAADIAPGISVQIYPGHTRHMQAVLIRSAGRTACYISDLIPTTAHLDLTWVMAFDLEPLVTIESRKRFYARAIPDEWYVIFTHDHNTPWARLRYDDRGKVGVVARGA